MTRKKFYLADREVQELGSTRTDEKKHNSEPGVNSRLPPEQTEGLLTLSAPLRLRVHQRPTYELKW